MTMKTKIRPGNWSRSLSPHFLNRQIKLALAAVSFTGLVSGCNTPALVEQQVNAQAPATPVSPPVLLRAATFSPEATPTARPTQTSTPTPRPTHTPIPTATPWPALQVWQPARLVIPTLAPLPVVSPSAASVNGDVVPVSYSPPDGVDMFGSGILRWEYYGQLAPDEWFDIKIKPLGSNDSAFVDWTKEKEYHLSAWSGWQPGLYTWQIGIVKGYKTGDTKEFIADTGRNSQPFIIKWQAGGQGGGGGGSSSGTSGGTSSGGS